MKSLVTLCLFLTSAIQVYACCMLPESYKGSISQDSQEALIIHDNGQENLILKVNPTITGDSAPESFAWIVTIPNKASAYKTIDAKIFADAYGFAQKVLSPSRSAASFGDDGFGDAMPASLAFGKRVQVGPYDIQPIRAQGDEALPELNNWLTQNGFPIETAEHMAYFIDNQFTFLCIKVVPGTQVLQGKIQLVPLQITFPSEKIYYPLIYSSQQGEFNLQLYTISDKRLDYAANQDILEKMTWQFTGLKKNFPFNRKHSQLPKTIQNLVTLEDKALYFNSLIATNPNRNKELTKWDQDLFLETNMSAKSVINWFDGFHDGESFGKAFGTPTSLAKDSRGKLTLTYVLDGGETLYLKKETRFFQALIIDTKKKKHKLPDMYLNPKVLHYTINSMLPRGRDGKIFFPDDINVADLPESTLKSCQAYLNEKFGEATASILSGKTLTRFQCLALEHDSKPHFLIFDSLTNTVLSPYQEIEK